MALVMGLKPSRKKATEAFLDMCCAVAYEIRLCLWLGEGEVEEVCQALLHPIAICPTLHHVANLCSVITVYAASHNPPRHSIVNLLQAKI